MRLANMERVFVFVFICSQLHSLLADTSISRRFQLVNEQVSCPAAGGTCWSVGQVYLARWRHLCKVRVSKRILVAPSEPLRTVTSSMNRDDLARGCSRANQLDLAQLSSTSTGGATSRSGSS